MFVEILQIAFCVVFYGGFVVLCISYWLATRREKRMRDQKVNPVGQLDE